MSGRGWLGVGLLAVTALGAGGGALAATTSGYSLEVSTPTMVEQGQSFTVKVSAFAKKSSGLAAFLSHQKCASSYTKEATAAVTGWKAGYPFFKPPGPGGSLVVPDFGGKGSLKQSFTAQAGTTTGTFYACAYLFSGGATSTTRAYDATTFKVSP